MAKVKQTKIEPGKLTAVRKKAPLKPPVMKDIQSVYRKHLRSIDIEALKKPWMASKSFVLLDTEEKLEAWVEGILADKSRWIKPFVNSEPMPVIAVDTETIGLDTRILTHYRKEWHVTGNEVLVPVYEVKAEIAGVVLSPDGITGVYIPINHQGCLNVSREAANRILQKLFDQSHQVFYNAKFDREVLRLTLALNLRDYPFYEDVQILNYINDPKADLGDDTFVTDGSGLKGLAKFHLAIEQINLSSITKVSAWRPWHMPTKAFEFLLAAEAKQAEIDGREIRPIPNQDRYIVHDKVSCIMQHVPFTWVPTDIAVWYAAADGISTWLLWDKLRHEAQSRKLVHGIDGKLIDTLTWMERQRTLIDTQPVARISKWHGKTMIEKRDKLRALAIEGGWVEEVDEDGAIIEDTIFDVAKPQKLAKLLYEKKRFKVVKRTPPSKAHPTGQPSTDANALLDLRKLYPDDPFLKELESYKEYVALHPDKLSFDPHDSTIRLYIKQATVGGGRLAASGGNFERDGGFGMNPQAIKSVGGNWWVTGDVLEPDAVAPEDVTPYEASDLHPSCIRTVDEDFTTGWLETYEDEAGNSQTRTFENQFPENIDSLPDDDPARFRVPIKEKRKVTKQAPGIINNHIGNYLGYAICLVPKCESCKKKFGLLIPGTKLDANQIVNFRQFFIAPKGWTFFTSDYSGIEMRVAANLSGEPRYIKEFLEGTGDFHTLTASVVFPEFNDPNTSKARRKELRSLAKIINFALQYGGTEYTIFTNMKTQKPDITWEEAKTMVRAYWQGVPVYKEFYDRMQRIAKEEMTCTTVFGRVVKFASQMTGLGIHEPTKEEMDNYWTYVRLRKQLRQAEEENDVERMKNAQEHMDRLWNDKDTGVRNAKEYNGFIGKIQRVSANIPSQGTAGDFMRISMNFIRRWANLIEPLVQSVFMLHSTVHDEIDYSSKNEYVPFVIPRITRFMRLRKLHAKMNWPVPIECDTEYGPSWDVKHHLTGDLEHKPIAWTAIEGMENYIPAEFDEDTILALSNALLSGKEKARERVITWLKTNIHSRALEVSDVNFPNADKDRLKVLLHILTGADKDEIRKSLIVLFQLHEYWTVDEVPYDQDASMETLEQYEARRGLTAADRGFMPEMGYLGAVPLDKAIRPELPVLQPEPELNILQKIYAEYVVERDKKKAASAAKKELKEGGAIQVEPEEAAPVKSEIPPAQATLKFVTEEPTPSPKAEPLPPPPEDDLFAPEPKRKPKAAAVQPQVFVPPPVPNPKGLPVMRMLKNSEEFKEFRFAIGMGTNKLTVLYGKKEQEFFCKVTELPEQYRG